MVLGILASWEVRRAAKRAAKQAAKRAMARSDEIDRQIENDYEIHKRRCDILLMGSWYLFYLVLPLGLICPCTRT